MSDPGQGSSVPPDSGQRGDDQYPPGAGPYGPDWYPQSGRPGQFGPPPGQAPPAPKQPLSERLASALDSWQKVVLAVTALLVAISGLSAVLARPGDGLPQPGPTVASSGGQAVYVPTSADQLPVTTGGRGSTSSAASMQPITPAAGPSTACRQATDAISTFKQNLGSTPLSEANAVQRAMNEIQGAIQSSGEDLTIRSDLVNIYNDLGSMYGLAMQGATSEFNGRIAQLNTDDQQLARDCG